MTDDARSFRTKTGRCTVADDRLLLSTEGADARLAGSMLGSSIGRMLVLCGTAGITLAAAGVFALGEGHNVVGLLLLAGGLLFLSVVLRSLDLSSAPEIKRTDVRQIEAHAPVAPAKRGYFVVHFVERGRPRRRLIIMPGASDGGVQEFERGKGLLSNAGFLAG